MLKIKVTWAGGDASEQTVAEGTTVQKLLSDVGMGTPGSYAILVNGNPNEGAHYTLREGDRLVVVPQKTKGAQG